MVTGQDRGVQAPDGTPAPQARRAVELLGAPEGRWLESLPDGLVVAGPDRRIRFANAEALRILDRSAGDLLGHRLEDALPLWDKYGRDWWAHTDPWDALGPANSQTEWLLVAPDGRDVLVTAGCLRAEPDGPVDEVLLGLRDAEARQRAERDQATVLSTVAHELRAPLTSVTGFTSSLLRRWDRFTDEQKRLMIETIESDAKRLTRLITELLDISRLDSDSLNLRLGPVDLHELLVTHVVRHELGRSAGAVRLRLGASAAELGLPEMWADSDRLEQVFFNLIENALQHGDGLVTVTLDRVPSEAAWPDGSRENGPDGARTGDRVPDDDILVIVDDEGDGVPEAEREKVFGRFWHGPSNASTGLGLYVVRGLVEAHGGTVVVGENEVGGAQFVVRLPSGLPEVVGP